MLRCSVFLALGALIALSGCAKTGSPPGGPVDEDPPWVVSTDPVDGAVDVPVDSGMFVLFSEEMDRASVERAIDITPETTLKTAGWRGPRLEIRTAEDLSDSTTYVVRLGDGIRDYHSVAADTAVMFAFSTGSAIDDCAVTGTVTTDGEPAVGATVWACAASPQPDSLGVVSRCGASAITASGGYFAIGYLNPVRSPYSLVAFLDSDADGAYSPREEAGTIVFDAATFAAPGDTVRGLDLALEPPADASAQPRGEPTLGGPTAGGTTTPQSGDVPDHHPPSAEPEEQE